LYPVELDRFPWDLGRESWYQITSLPWLPGWKLHDPTAISFESVPARDRQTDGQTDRWTRRLYLSCAV